MLSPLFEENEKDCCYQAGKSGKMVPLQALSLEEDNGEEGEDGYGDDLLDDLELHQGKCTAIAHEADAVGRYLAGVFEECQEPADEDDDVERCVVRDELHLLQLEMTIPSEGHEDVGDDEQ